VQLPGKPQAFGLELGKCKRPETRPRSVYTWLGLSYINMRGAPLNEKVGDLFKLSLADRVEGGNLAGAGRQLYNYM